MNIVIIILGVMFLCGVNVGKALAICSIIEGSLILLEAILKIVWKFDERP